MKLLFYRFLIRLSRKLGTWIFSLGARGVAAGYFLFLPRRTAVSIRFYRSLFPDQGLWQALRRTWRQYQNFTHIYLDRFLLRDREDVTFESEGFEYLTQALEAGTGGIILMSHMGNWEISAHVLRRKGARLMLYVGEKVKEQIEKLQKRGLAESGVRMVVVGEGGGSPLDILEGIDFLRQGGLVSLTGDRLWDPGQRTVTVRFAGHAVRLPEAPHLFALLSGAPLLVFFAYRVGERHFRFKTCAPWHVRAPSRALRGEAVQASAQAYADLLEAEVRRNPGEWFHFEPFLGDRSPS